MTSRFLAELKVVLLVVFHAAVTTDESITVIAVDDFWLIVAFTSAWKVFPFFNWLTFPLFQVIQRRYFVLAVLTISLVGFNTLCTDECNTLLTKCLSYFIVDFWTSFTLELHLAVGYLHGRNSGLQAVDKESSFESIYSSSRRVALLQHCG